MAQFALLTGSVVRETLHDRKGELVVERAPASEGPGWVITLQLDDARCVVVTERRIQLRIFREVNSAITFVERNNPDQSEIRVLTTEASGIPDLRLPEGKPAADEKQSSKPARKRKNK